MYVIYGHFGDLAANVHSLTIRMYWKEQMHLSDHQLPKVLRWHEAEIVLVLVG